jgi:hypothetical protein
MGCCRRSSDDIEQHTVDAHVEAVSLTAVEHFFIWFLLTAFAFVHGPRSSRYSHLTSGIKRHCEPARVHPFCLAAF